jgi:hypothetical protein
VTLPLPDNSRTSSQFSALAPSPSSTLPTHVHTPKNCLSHRGSSPAPSFAPKICQISIDSSNLYTAPRNPRYRTTIISHLSALSNLFPLVAQIFHLLLPPSFLRHSWNPNQHAHPMHAGYSLYLQGAHTPPRCPQIWFELFTSLLFNATHTSPHDVCFPRHPPPMQISLTPQRVFPHHHAQRLIHASL